MLDSRQVRQKTVKYWVARSRLLAKGFGTKLAFLEHGIHAHPPVGRLKPPDTRLDLFSNLSPG